MAMAAMLQMVASADGHIIDEWVLTKPSNWTPDPKGRAAAVSTFVPHPPTGWMDRIGLSFGVYNPVRSPDLSCLP